MAWDRSGRSSAARGYGYAWRKARAVCLADAGGLCQIQGPNCTTTATQVDHVLGIRNDPGHQHLRAVCKNCHDQHTQQQAAAARRGNPDPQGRSYTNWNDPAPTPRTQW